VTIGLVSNTLLFLTPNGVTDCFKGKAFSVLVGRYADFASLPAHRVASCMHDFRDTKQWKGLGFGRLYDTVCALPSSSVLSRSVVLVQTIARGCGIVLPSNCIYTPSLLAVTMGMRLQKTTPTCFQSRSASGQSTLSAHTSSSASPSIEKAGYLATPEPQSPLPPNLLSRPSSRLRSESPSSPPYNKVSTAGTLSPVVVEREQKRSRRRSWFGRSKSAESIERGPAAWVMGHQEQRPYNLDHLAGGDRVQDLWDESADCEIHLFARLSGKGSSFRLDSTLLASSKLLSELVLPSDTGKSLVLKDR